MLEVLQFVSRGVAKRDPTSTGLMHFAIREGRVTGSNSTLTFSAPLTLSFETAPLAVPFIRALDACKDTISITQQCASLLVRAGDFKASVPCVAVNTIPNIRPEGKLLPCAGIVSVFRVLKPFISTDTNKPWACSCLVEGNSVTTTNNIIVAEHYLATPFPFRVNVPVVLIDELLRIKEEPTKVQMSEFNITFHYADGRWIKSQLSAQEGPNMTATLNEVCAKSGTRTVITQPFKDACAIIRNYNLDGMTYFHGIGVATAKTELETGHASVAVPCYKEGCYLSRYLAPVLEIATEADWDRYPGPVVWMGKGVRGLLVGVRV